MRPLIFFALLSIVCSGSLHPQMPEGKNITINLKLDSTISNHEQWVYLHRYDDNEFLIEDSAFIKKGQKEITLYGYTPEEHAYSVLFAKKGPIELYLILAPNSYIETDISETDNKMNVTKKVKGSYATNEYVDNIKKQSAIHQKKRELYAELSRPDLSDNEEKRIQKQLDIAEMQLDSMEMNLINNSQSPSNVWGALYRFSEKVKRDSLTTLVKKALKRFPNNKKIKSLIYKPKNGYPPESEASKQRSERIFQIIDARINESIKLKEKKEETTTNINDLTFLSDKGEEVTISKLTGEYILIDFWASWCIPCLEGMPYIKQAEKMCNGKLKVCLISMDKDHKTWKECIVRWKVENFVNLTAINSKGEQIEGVNIKAIPYNYLLNKDHEIVATHIHQKELLEKLNELMKKE